jgi:hypothetical protein
LRKAVSAAAWCEPSPVRIAVTRSKAPRARQASAERGSALIASSIASPRSRRAVSNFKARKFWASRIVAWAKPAWASALAGLCRRSAS